MFQFLCSRLVFGAALVLACGAASAASANPGPRELGLLTIGAGRSGYRQAPDAEHVALTYHHRPVLWRLRPSVGITGSSVGDSFFFFGTSFDVGVTRRIGFTPLLSAGYYEQGAGMNLGGAFEFRSGLEIFLRVTPSSRVGASIHHISNAGLFHRNPGRESLFLTYGFSR